MCVSMFRGGPWEHVGKQRVPVVLTSVQVIHRDSEQYQFPHQVREESQNNISFHRALLESTSIHRGYWEHFDIQRGSWNESASTLRPGRIINIHRGFWYAAVFTEV